MTKLLVSLCLLCSAFSAQGQSMMRGPELGPQPSSGPIIPSVVNTFNTGLTSTTTTLTLSSAITAGNVLVTVQYWGGGNGGVLNFTDSLGNTGTTLKSEDLIVDGDTVAVACAPITTGGSGDVVTFTQSGTASAQRATVYEVHNTTCTQDVTAVSANPAGHVTACNSTALTTATANDFLVGACGGDGTSTSSIPAGSGWSGGTNTGNGGTQFILMSEWQIATTPGPFTATSGTIASQETAAICVALKAL